MKKITNLLQQPNKLSKKKRGQNANNSLYIHYFRCFIPLLPCSFRICGQFDYLMSKCADK